MSRTSFSIPLFFLVALSVLYLCHYFIYFSVVHLLGVAVTRRKVALGVMLFLLPTSFVVSSILAHRSLSLFSRVFYFFSGLWLGVGLALIFFFALAWAAWGATRLVAHSPSPALFGWAALVLACGYSAYGVWNAHHLRTREIAVRIKNLPPEWQGKKVVQISDVHVGYIRGAEFLEEIVERANAQNPSAVFITGDLFDGSDGRLDELVAPLRNLRAPRGIYFVTGNHEVYLGAERAAAALQKTPVRILSDEMVVVEGLQIVGVSYPKRGFSKDVASVLRNLPNFRPQSPSILLYHNPAQTEQARAAGINLQLAGHTHQGQIFPMQFVTRLFYGRFYRGLHVEGDYTIYTSSGAGTWGPALRTGNRPEIVAIRLE
jgi:uncharacterized protein